MRQDIQTRNIQLTKSMKNHLLHRLDTTLDLFDTCVDSVSTRMMGMKDGNNQNFMILRIMIEQKNGETVFIDESHYDLMPLVDIACERLRHQLDASCSIPTTSNKREKKKSKVA